MLGCMNLFEFEFSFYPDIFRGGELLDQVAGLFLGFFFRTCHCCCSVSSEWLCDSMGCSTTGFPVLRSLLEFVQTHVYGAYDAIQPSHPLSSPSPPAFSPFQHQSLFHIRYWIWFPLLCSRSLLFIYFKYLLIPNSWFIPSLPLSPLIKP